jgi:glutamate/tyrosine decarboxylase-like PLP-dependent enzyme
MSHHDWRAALWPVPQESREQLARVQDHILGHWEALDTHPVSPTTTREERQELLGALDFDRGIGTVEAGDLAADLLSGGMVHSTSPNCFGLFNPTPAFPGILADLLTAAFNPQLAVWSHAPAAVEMEDTILGLFARKIGFPHEAGSAHFTTGGAEANSTALQVALTRAHPDYSEKGNSAFGAPPLIYASAESHLAWLKIAHQCGLGREAVRLVPVDRQGCLDVAALRQMLADDKENGGLPILIVATAGTTNAGMIDPLLPIAEEAKRRNIHFHVDAAWAGSAAICSGLATVLTGMNLADSLTIDAHKWLSVPMGAGMFFARKASWMRETFHVATHYMPSGDAALDPYTQTQQWSRRFIGLKLFMLIASIGFDGIGNMIRHQTAKGEYLKQQLNENGWPVINDTPLPVACFTDRSGNDPSAVVEKANATGRVWLSSTTTAGVSCARACVTSFLTNERHADNLIAVLNEVRASL